MRPSAVKWTKLQTTENRSGLVTSTSADRPEGEETMNEQQKRSDPRMPSDRHPQHSHAAPETDDTFELYDLRVEVVEDGSGRPMVCDHPVGSYFELRGESLSLPPGQTFPIYPLAAILPLLPAKQRVTDPNDWMTTDAEIACPDPHCGGRFRIRRIGKRTFHHGDVTVVPLGCQGESP